MRVSGAVDENDKVDRSDASKLIRRAMPMLRPYRRKVLLAGVIVILWTAAVLAGPLLVKVGIDDGIKGGADGGDPRVLNMTVIAYILVATGKYFLDRGQVLTISTVGENFLRDLRVRLFDHLQRLSMPFYDREKAGVIVSRMTSDIDSLQELVQTSLLMFVSNSLLLFASVGVLAIVSWKLALLCLLAVPPVIAASIRFQRESNVAYLDVRDGIGATLSHLQEGFSGVRVVQAFGRETVEEKKFNRRNRGLYDAHMKSVKISAWYLPVIEFAGVATTAAALGVGGYWVLEGDLTVGTVTFFVLTLSNLFEPIQQLSQLFNTVQSAAAGLNKIFGLLDTDVDVPERPGAIDVPASGDIVVDDVGFAYSNGVEVLAGVSLHINAGEKMALVGPTGAGKSTLAKLIARFYDPTTGSISIGGVDLRDATISSLRRQMAVVPQEGFLFNESIIENVRLARPDATDDEVAAAMDSIGVLDRFAALPDGIHTEVRERGSRFSAGEKQLVSLARAALADPAVLVLDEATSSLDPGTEAVVEAAMERLSVGRTTIVIAHRLTTAARADRVAVVAAGGLAEVGTHDELMARGGHYAALYGAWAGGQPA